MKTNKTRGAKELADWREAQEPRVTQHRLAVALDAKSVFTISKWERGVQLPTILEALAIERFTGGAVRIAAWAEPIKDGYKERRSTSRAA